MPQTDYSEIKIGVALLEKSVSDLVIAQTESIRSQTKTHELMTKVFVEMGERDVKDEFLKEEVKRLATRQNQLVSVYMPVIDRAKKDQDRHDKFIDSVTSGWGKMLAGAVVAGALLLLAQALHVDATTLIR
jgi:hypothetical protein